MADFASEQTHWYRKDGTPFHTIIGANGKERNTTVRDARKLGLVRSVTGIGRILDRPGLNVWKENNLLLSALTSTRREGESEQGWIYRIKEDAKAQAAKAAEEGTAIHAAIERWLCGQEYDERYGKHVDAVRSWLSNRFGPVTWAAEKSFACHLGYGGKVDLHGDDVVIDFKGKDFTEKEPPKTYEEHAIQLAAYRYGLNMPQAECWICFVSRNEPGTISAVQLTADELRDGWEIFQALLTISRVRDKL